MSRWPPSTGSPSTVSATESALRTSDREFRVVVRKDYPCCACFRAGASPRKLRHIIMTVADNVRVGVAGCGHWGRNLVRNFHELGALAGVCDVDRSILDQMRRNYPVLATEC